MSADEDLRLLRWLQEALDTPEAGLELDFESPLEMKRFRSKLVVLRLKHEEYRPLSFRDMGDKLWIVKNARKTEEAHAVPS